MYSQGSISAALTYAMARPMGHSAVLQPYTPGSRQASVYQSGTTCKSLERVSNLDGFPRTLDGFPRTWCDGSFSMDVYESNPITHSPPLINPTRHVQP